MKPGICYHKKENILNIGASWDKLSPTKESAIKYAYKYLNHDPKQYIEGKPQNGNNHTLEFLLADSWETINDRYRSGSEIDIDLKIAEKLNEYECKTDLILYRGVCEPVYELMKKNRKPFSNYDLLEKGFMATSLVKGHEYDYSFKLRIYVPKGSHTLYQGNINGHRDLYEVDIQHGARLKIISIDNTYINCRLIGTS